MWHLVGASHVPLATRALLGAWTPLLVGRGSILLPPTLAPAPPVLRAASVTATPHPALLRVQHCALLARTAPLDKPSTQSSPRSRVLLVLTVRLGWRPLLRVVLGRTSRMRGRGLRATACHALRGGTVLVGAQPLMGTVLQGTTALRALPTPPRPSAGQLITGCWRGVEVTATARCVAQDTTV
jgi:hypothetical protein